MAPKFRGFSVVEDGDGEIVYVARKDYTESDKPLRFAVRVMYCEAWDSEWSESGKYHVEVCAVGPAWVDEGTRGRAAEQFGMTPKEWSELGEEWRCVALMNYGTRACLWQEQGNNLRKLLKTARKELDMIEGVMFGFYMDRPQNAIGDSGWDFISGRLGAALRKEE